MSLNFKYETDLLGGSIMVRECRRVANLLLQKVSEEEWRRAIIQENVLQKKTISTAQRNAGAIRSRLELLDSGFWKAIRDGDDELAIQAAFCAVLERNLLLMEFMEKELKDAFAMHQEKLNVYQWKDFVEECGNRDPSLYLLKESSIKKMGQIVFRMLAEIGYLENTRSMKLKKILVRSEIKNLLQTSSRQRILKCMEMS